MTTVRLAPPDMPHGISGSTVVVGQIARISQLAAVGARSALWPPQHYGWGAVNKDIVDNASKFKGSHDAAYCC